MKKYFTYAIYTFSLLSVSSELSSFVDIITLPYGANYSYQKVLNLLFHAATFSNNTLKTANSD